MDANTKITKLTALNQAIQARGGITALAKALDLKSHAVINQWRKTQVPAERCPAIEQATGGLVRCEDLRPDVAWHVVRGRPAAALPGIGVKAAEHFERLTEGLTLQDRRQSSQPFEGPDRRLADSSAAGKGG